MAKGQKKTPKVPGRIRSVLSANTDRLMKRHFVDSSNKPMSLAKAAHVSLSTVQRILDQQTGATIDNVELVAAVFGMAAYQILVPQPKPGSKIAAEQEELVEGASQVSAQYVRAAARRREHKTSPRNDSRKNRDIKSEASGRLETEGANALAHNAPSSRRGGKAEAKKPPKKPRS